MSEPQLSDGRFLVSWVPHRAIFSRLLFPSVSRAAFGCSVAGHLARGSDVAGLLRGFGLLLGEVLQQGFDLPQARPQVGDLGVLLLHDLVKAMDGRQRDAVGVHGSDGPVAAPKPKAAWRSCALGPMWRTPRPSA